MPTPAFTNSPPIIIAKLKTPDKYNSVNITEEAQFGIKPISPPISVPNIGLFSISPPNLSSPTNSIIIFKC